MKALRPVQGRSSWSDAELSALRQLIGLELPMAYIAQRLNRSRLAVSREAQRIAIADMLQCPQFLPE